MRVGIIGAGPAGTVCALALLRGAERRGQSHEVLLFDGKSFLRVGPRGCNMCAGVISGALLDGLARLGAPVPEGLIQRRLTGHYFGTRAGGVHVPKHPESSICTVFRSVGPSHAPPAVAQSFDQFLLRNAVAAGAVHLNVNLADVRMPAGASAPFELTTATGDTHEVDVLIGAFGVNTPLARRFEQLGFGYRRPDTFRVQQAEIPLDRQFIRASYRDEAKIFSLGLPRIRFGAMTPKREHVTVTVIGRHLQRGDLELFLRHPTVRRYFPRNWRPPLHHCHCQPRLPVTAARNPVADRLLVIGDANLSRYLKGGIDSAFFTGTLAAKMVLDGCLTRDALLRRYVRPCHARYRYDNVYGRALFRCNDLISRMAPVALAGLRLIEREQCLPRWSDRHHTEILWHIFTGEAPYRVIARDALRPSSALRALSALFSTTIQSLPVGRATK